MQLCYPRQMQLRGSSGIESGTQVRPQKVNGSTDFAWSQIRTCQRRLGRLFESGLTFLQLSAVAMGLLPVPSGRGNRILRFG